MRSRQFSYRSKGTSVSSAFLLAVRHLAVITVVAWVVLGSSPFLAEGKLSSIASKDMRVLPGSRSAIWDAEGSQGRGLCADVVVHGWAAARGVWPLTSLSMAPSPDVPAAAAALPCAECMWTGDDCSSSPLGAEGGWGPVFVDSSFPPTEEIIGQDDRRLLTEEERSVHSAVGVIVCANAELGEMTSTASVVGNPYTVVGAAHGFWSRTLDRWFDPVGDCVFRLVTGNVNRVVFETKFTLVGVGAQYGNKILSTSADDWAVLKLDYSVPSGIRPYSYGHFDDAKKGQRFPVVTLGFQVRADANEGKITMYIVPSCETWYEGADRYDLAGLELRHDCDMHSGASGGPLLFRTSESFVFIGINTRDGFGSDGLMANRGVRVNRSLYAVLERVMGRVPN